MTPICFKVFVDQSVWTKEVPRRDSRGHRWNWIDLTSHCPRCDVDDEEDGVRKNAANGYGCILFLWSSDFSTPRIKRERESRPRFQISGGDSHTKSYRKKKRLFWIIYLRRSQSIIYLYLPFSVDAGQLFDVSFFNSNQKEQTRNLWCNHAQ